VDNPYLEYAQFLQQRVKENGATYIPTDDLEQYGLNTVDCPICGNTGRVVREDENGVRYAGDCKCMVQRRAIRRIRKSGLADVVERYTFDRYLADNEKRRAVKDAALRYTKDNQGWFFVAGKTGSGKSHICTAICSELMKRQNLRYVLWRDVATRLKAMTTDADAYAAEIQPLKDVAVLYIDDFLKGKVTDADLNLAFELLNYRYNDAKKRTIISTERSIYEIMELDEALGGRIFERCKGYCVEAPDENYRTGGAS
jgi:DNA replication protein DnaC